MAFTVLPVPQPRLIHKPYLRLAALQFVDVATTWWILHFWSVRGEGNPLIASLLNGVGLPIGMLTILALKLGVVYLLWICQTGTRIASAVYSLVVLNNLLFLFLWLIS